MSVNNIAVMVEPEAVSTEHAAIICGCSRAFLLRLIQEGVGPRKIKIGKRTLFLKSDLRTWLEAQAQPQIKGD